MPFKKLLGTAALAIVILAPLTSEAGRRGCCRPPRHCGGYHHCPLFGLLSCPQHCCDPYLPYGPGPACGPVCAPLPQPYPPFPQPCGPQPCGQVPQPCGPFPDPCAPCGQPVITQPMQPIIEQTQRPVYQTQLRPVVETQFQPRQVVTYQNVPQTQYQRQAYTENVPVTTVQTVTVDEGGYQTVWVPKPVQKQVPQTVYQSQTRYRDVAVQVMQQTPVVQTQMVPQQIVRYVPETRQIGVQPAGSRIIGWQPGPATITGWQYGPNGIPMTAGLPAFTLQGEPIPAGIPAPGGSINLPTPDPQYLQTPAPASASADGWQTIQQRGAAAERHQSYNPAPISASPAPTAATVWQSRRETQSVIR